MNDGNIPKTQKQPKKKQTDSESESLHSQIAKLEKLALANRKRAERAERSSYAKEAYLAKMSHEIRTPLDAILGLGKLLMQTDLDEKQLDLLSSIQSASEDLLVIINDILDFSKIEAGKIVVENVGFDLKKLALKALNMVQYKAEEKMLSLFLEMDKNIAPVLIGDPHRINQVLMNMVSNALKFTERGSVSIKATLLEQTKTSQEIQIVVKDTGIGMSDDYLKHLFDIFSQEDDSVARKFGGTGLGMSISKQLVDLMGGTLHVESRKNEGTMVSLTFKLKIGTEEDLRKHEEFNGDTSILNNKRILLVDDSRMNRLVTLTVLQRYGATIFEAENGIYALELLKEKPVDLILMDVRMPFMDGFEATRIIREQMKNEVTIIALTANVIKGNDRKCLDAGMNDFISKPYDEKKLLQMVLKWLGKDSKNQVKSNGNGTGAVQLVPHRHENIVASNNLYNLSKLRSIGNDEFVRQMLQLFVKEVPESIEKIKSAYQTHDFQAVKYIAHRIRPSIVNLEISEVKDEILEIEEAAASGRKTERLETLIGKVDSMILRVVDIIKAENRL